MEVELNANTGNMSESHDSALSMPTLKEGKFNKRTKWSNQENEKLTRLVGLYGINQWEKISKCFIRRTDLQCKMRWQKLSNMRLVKEVLRPWTKEEDDKLKELVAKYGPEKWNFIAQHLDKRIGRHCKERWNDIMNPASSKREQKSTKVSWSVQERKLLLHYYNLYGSQWKRIAERIGTGRTDNAVKAYWNCTFRKFSPFQGPVKRGRPKKKFINESSSTMPKFKIRESLQTSDGKPAVGSKRRGRKPKNMLIPQEGLPETSALSDIQTVNTNSEPKSLLVLLNKYGIDSTNEGVPSTTTVISENTNSTSDSENVFANCVLDEVLQSMLYDKEDISNKRKENIVVQSPSARNPRQFSVKTPQNYPNKCMHTKPNIHLDAPSTSSMIPENSDSSSTFARMSADGVLKQDLRRTELQNIENGVGNSISKKKKIVTIQSPSSMNLYQFPAKTTRKSHNKACKCMKHSILSKGVPSGPATENSNSPSTNENFHANSVLNPELSREKLQSVENITSKRTKSVITQSPSKNSYQLLAKTPQNPNAQEIPEDVNNQMDDIIIVNVHSLNSDKSFQVKSEDKEFSPRMLPEDTENNCNSCLLSEEPEGSAENISNKSHQGETSVNASVGQMSESRPALLEDNQIISEDPLIEAENSSDSSSLQDLSYGKLQTSDNQTMKQNDFSCSSAEADCSSPVTDIMEEGSINQPQCSSQAKSQAHDSLFCQNLRPEMLQENRNADCNQTSSLNRLSSECNFEQSIGNVCSQFVETLQTSNFLPTTSLNNTFLKRKNCQNASQTSTPTTCANETPAGSSQSQCFHTSKDLTPETFTDNQLASQNDFENRIGNFFNRMQSARHTYEMICGNILREFEKLVSEAAVSDSSDLGPFSFMKPFLDKHQSNSRSFNALEFMKLFFMVFGDKIDISRIKELVSTDSNQPCCCKTKVPLNRVQQCTSSRSQSNSSVEIDASRCHEPQEQETQILKQSTSEEHPRRFKKKRKVVHTMKTRTRME